MKIKREIFRFVLLISITSLAFSRTGINIVGGINYSTITPKLKDKYGSDIIIIRDANPKSVWGYKLGIEKYLKNFITGFTYSQLGHSANATSLGTETLTIDIYQNYIRGHFYFYKNHTSLILDEWTTIFGLAFGYLNNMSLNSQYCKDDECEYNSYKMFNNDLNKAKIQRTDFGIVFGSRYNLTPKYSLQTNVYYSINPFVDGDWDERIFLEYHNLSFQINVSCNVFGEQKI